MAAAAQNLPSWWRVPKMNGQDEDCGHEPCCRESARALLPPRQMSNIDFRQRVTSGLLPKNKIKVGGRLGQLQADAQWQEP